MDKKNEKKEWENQIREKIDANKDLSQYLSDVEALDEKAWPLKNLLCKMTAIFDISKREKNSHLKTMIILGAMYLIGIIIIITNKDSSIWGYILVGAASSWKFFTWGSDADDYNAKTGNVSYTARTDMFGQVKIEQNTGNIGCIMGIIGLVLGIVVTPILFLRSLFKFLKSNKTFQFAQEVVEELENELKIRYTWDKKKLKWHENVL